ncbi:MAG: DUF192 domain-containing protein [Acidobacteriaceae bacterium]
MKRITIVNRSRAIVVGTRIEVADTFLTRLVGLLGRRRLHADSGLLIQPSSGVHTFGMRFPIDVVALDRKFRVLAVWHDLRPWRTSSVNWRTHAVLELSAGHLRACPMETGDQLEIAAAD